MKRKRVEVNLEELDQIIDRGTQAPLSESESEKLKSALHALAGMLPKLRHPQLRRGIIRQSALPVHMAAVVSSYFSRRLPVLRR